MAYLTGISPTLRELVTPTVDVFADGVGFNDGSSTYIDLSADPGNENNVHITFDGVTQHHDTYTVSGVRVTFDAAIPTGTAKIEARYAQEHPNYTVVADNAITNAKMNDDAIGVAELSASGTASSSTFLRGDNAWASPGGSNVLEALHMVCDGSSTTVSSGTYTSTNVTAAQNTTTTYTDISGSSISYTPPSGTKTVLYEFRFMWGYLDSAMGSLYHLLLDGTEVTNARYSQYNVGLVGEEGYFRWVFKIGDGAVAATGKVASWSSAKIIKLQVRSDYSNYRCKLHETHFWDGSTASHLSKPTISVTSLS